MEKKYKLTDETIKVYGHTLHRIKARRSFAAVRCGDLGGFIEREDNLSHDGECWVGGYAVVSGEAYFYGDAQVYDNAAVYGDAQIVGNAKVTNMADYIVFKNWWSSGRYFTWTRSNNMWSVGCFHGTGDELIKRAYKDSELSGREYERVVKYVNEILKNGN